MFLLKTNVQNLVIGGTSQDAKILRKFILNEKNESTDVVSRNSTKLEKYSNERHFDADLSKFDLISYLLEGHTYKSIFIFAAQSSVSESFRSPALTFHINCQLPLHVFQKCLEQGDHGKILVPLSSECFGTSEIPCSANTPFRPISPYGTPKAVLRDFGEIYREKGLRIDLPILFNHESIYRASFSVLWKLIKFINKIKLDPRASLEIGNLEMIRDWSHANEITGVMYHLSKLQNSNDLCVGSGHSFSISEMVNLIEGLTEIDISSRLVRSNKYMRKNDIYSSYCDCSKLESLEISTPTLSGRSLMHKLLEDYNVI